MKSITFGKTEAIMAAQDIQQRMIGWSSSELDYASAKYYNCAR